jgi:hypothetical protein
LRCYHACQAIGGLFVLSLLLSPASSLAAGVPLEIDEHLAQSRSRLPSGDLKRQILAQAGMRLIRRVLEFRL